jgi:nickel/cobalt exporter
LSVKHVATRWSGFAVFAQRAPYASGVLIILVGLYMGLQGWNGIHHVHGVAAAAAVAELAEKL